MQDCLRNKCTSTMSLQYGAKFVPEFNVKAFVKELLEAILQQPYRGLMLHSLSSFFSCDYAMATDGTSLRSLLNVRDLLKAAVEAQGKFGSEVTMITMADARFDSSVYHRPDSKAAMGLGPRFSPRRTSLQQYCARSIVDGLQHEIEKRQGRQRGLLESRHASGAIRRRLHALCSGCFYCTSIGATCLKLHEALVRGTKLLEARQTHRGEQSGANGAAQQHPWWSTARLAHWSGNRGHPGLRISVW